MALREWSALPYANTGDFTSLSSFTAEASLMAGHSSQLPFVPANFFDNARKTLRLRAEGVATITSTPTLTIKCRFHTSPVAATSSVSGTVVGTTATITTAAATDKQWEIDLAVTCITPGSGSSALSVMANGWMFGVFLGSPFRHPVQPTAPDTSTWTVALDASQTYWPNFTATAGGATVAITLKRLLMYWDN